MNTPNAAIIVITRDDQVISYASATAATVSRKGALRIYRGWRQIAVHDPGQWTAYTVTAPLPAALRA